MGRSTLLRLAVSATLASTALHAGAVINDNGSNPVLPAGLNLSGVGQLSNGCTSVLLAGGQYMLASAHCAAGVGSAVIFGGGAATATVTSTMIAPGFGDVGENDLSISRLDVQVTTVSSYAWASSAGALPTAIVLAGYGGTGSGASGVTGFGTLRYGFNDYEVVLADDPNGNPPAFYGGNVVGFDFDDGSAALNRFGNLGQAGEAGLAPGDSGGPSFAFVAGGWQIVGIHLGVDEDFGFGFGAVGYDMLVGNYAGWINSVTGVAAVPEPASGLLLAAGLLGIAGLARRR